MKITFQSQSLRDKVQLYYANRKVLPFIFKVTQCQKCFLFGHGTSLCKGKERCSLCGENTHLSATCTKLKPKCLHCQGEHKSNDKACPELEQQKLSSPDLSMKPQTHLRYLLIIHRSQPKTKAIRNRSTFLPSKRLQKLLKGLSNEKVGH